MSASTNVVAALLEDDFDPAAEVDRAIPDVPATMAWDDVQHRWNVRAAANNRWIGTIVYDPQDDVPAHANQEWKSMHWLASPWGSAEQKMFKTSAEAMQHLLKVARIAESDFDSKSEIERLVSPPTRSMLCAWMAEAGIEDFAMNPAESARMEIRGYMHGTMLNVEDRLSAFMDRLEALSVGKTERSIMQKHMLLPRFVNTAKPAVVMKRDIRFQIPAKMLSPDPPSHE